MFERLREQFGISQSEFTFLASRGSGPGGQNVNKVNSKATMFWNIDLCSALGEEVKDRFRKMYLNRINAEGDVVISSDTSRDYKRNQAYCLERLEKMIIAASKPPKKRVKTKPSTAAVEKRLTSKRKHAQRKKDRRIDW